MYFGTKWPLSISIKGYLFAFMYYETLIHRVSFIIPILTSGKNSGFWSSRDKIKFHLTQKKQTNFLFILCLFSGFIKYVWGTQRGFYFMLDLSKITFMLYMRNKYLLHHLGSDKFKWDISPGNDRISEWTQYWKS